MNKYYLKKSIIIEEFETINNFAEKVGCSRQNISKHFKFEKMDETSCIYKYIVENNLEKILKKSP